MCAHESGCSKNVHAQDLCKSHYSWAPNRAPTFKRTHPGTHHLTSINYETCTGDCTICGPDMKLHKNSSGVFRVYTMQAVDLLCGIEAGVMNTSITVSVTSEGCDA